MSLTHFLSITRSTLGKHWRLGSVVNKEDGKNINGDDVQPEALPKEVFIKEEKPADSKVKK